MRVLRLCVLLGLLAGGCAERSVEEDGPEVAVTNTYLSAAVADLCGEGMKVMCLAPPGMCPGHFDISPGQVGQLRHCRLLLLFDFQSQVEAALARLKDKGLKTHLVEEPKGLCVPDSYLAICRDVAGVLEGEYPERAAELAERLEAIERRLGALGDELRGAVADSGAALAHALASHHQSRFAEWLGLETVASFVGSDTETVGHIDHCLKQAAGHDVRFVIANQQEGTVLALALAERLDAHAVVFSNFPSEAVDGLGFDRMLRGNVERLLEAASE
jgi:zinc/manganese transport system substrate-binding protein